MAGDGKTPGNGMTSPYGNGMGGTSGPRAKPFVQQQNPQGPVRDIEIDQASIPAGGKILTADVPPQRQAQVGTTAGPNRKPFSLRG